MITGATSGIGYAIADRFLQEGVEKIILVGRSKQRLADTAARLGEFLEGVETGNGSDEILATRAPEEDQQEYTGIGLSGDRRVSFFVGDVSESGPWVRELEEKMKDVDILVNAAGISTTNILARTDPDAISHTLRTNLEGTILISRALLRAAIRSRSKDRNSTTEISSRCIINISSLLAHKGGTGAVSYAASKAGVLGLTRSLAVEAATSLRGVFIRSNAIVPGYIDTPMIANFSDAQKTSLKDEIPLGRFGDPQEVADAAVFLAQNEYANNCILNLDGGLSAI
ncbi:SDR family NAD(P)-dependent oxidoreductase [Aspergillus chevalieri]|uniref:3-oxoacyl-acyl carrier protein reductase n=1 Tax=Aspergillus chevalieri TaxID=182096 RepID=A0A7R7VT48_ASPCH|nr:uncharacterized protein ACHE_60197S [Aspergillus chevalieri]BCR90311.1 hypothetical protein ACHE_60197S [Aspergillus chevalieri]